MMSRLSRYFLVSITAFCLAGFSAANATERLYKRECNGCHSAPPTCNGCHAHGVHEKTGDTASLNIVATTDLPTYAAGDDIVVTLKGGNQPHANGWVGFKLYDEKGVELTHFTGELPATLKTRAYEGMTKLYVAWIGFDYDSAGAHYGAPITATIAEGTREAFRAGVHKDQVHIEEIVATNAIVVGAVDTLATDAATDSTATAADGSSDATSGGGGAFDLFWILAGFLGITLVRATTDGPQQSGSSSLLKYSFPFSLRENVKMRG